MKRYYILLLLVSTVGFSQNLNQYKYALVPSKFSFLKEENMYNLNVLTKMFLQKYGFETYLSNEVTTEDFAITNCNKIFVDIISNSGIFTTKVKVVIKDCKGTILCSSEEGSSRDKEYRVAYNEALRAAFDSFSVLKTHQYKPSEKSMGMVVDPAQTDVAIKKEDVLTKEIAKGSMDTKKYTAVATETGYNLLAVASDYKVFQIFKTSVNDVFIVNRDGVNGILINKNNSWFFEYYDKNVLKSETIKVEFLK
jgi:hypothetical protein